MKPTLLFSFLLFAFVTAAAAQTDAVLDTSGDELRNSSLYYILPVVRGRGGDLTVASSGNETCPLYVVQAQQEVDNGLSVTFSPVDKGVVVRLSTDLNIKFSSSAAAACAQSTVWMLDFDDSLQQSFVTTGGVQGNPSLYTLSNWFKIDKFEDDYKLVFCPGVCEVCRPLCGDIGIYVDQSGNRRLALSDTPFKVMFKKA